MVGTKDFSVKKKKEELEQGFFFIIIFYDDADGALFTVKEKKNFKWEDLNRQNLPNITAILQFLLKFIRFRINPQNPLLNFHNPPT